MKNVIFSSKTGKKVKIYFLDYLNPDELETFLEVLEYADDNGIYDEVLFMLHEFFTDIDIMTIKSSLQALGKCSTDGEKPRGFYISNIIDGWRNWNKK